MTRTALVHGIAVAGEAVARRLVERGWNVLVSDDDPNDAKRSRAASFGTELVERPDRARLVQMVAASDLVCPAPGVPETHDLVDVAASAGVPIRTEIDLAYLWEQERRGGPRPMLAVTGTDGKTTTTMLAAHMVRAGGRRAAAVGNTERPLVDALDDEVDVFVVECSSFRLHFAEHFRAEASVWLNLAPDHLNWHRSLASYEGAKARMWAHLRADDVAVGNADDEVVMRNLARVSATTRTFASTGADYRIEDDSLVGPMGTICTTDRLTRALPHDLTNALAAASLVLETGLATPSNVADALATFVHPPHRIEPVAEFDGVRWFNDSKATTPHAALTAIRGFERIVLLAGGRNKGLDLASLAQEHRRIKAVVGLGEAGPVVAAAFAEHCPVTTAASMADAVERAAEFADEGDVVLLSPACASFDWYPEGGYPARGEDFKRLVSERRRKVGAR